MGFSLTILRTYASSDPASLPPTVLLRSSDANIAVWDKFPKAMFHFLVLPRIRSPITEKNASNLSSLIRWDKKKAHECLLRMKSDAEEVKVMIEDEMVKNHGFSWDIWMGFHAVPSMEHLHMHVISSDLCSASLKNKKHYNSFHPKLGFFIHLDDVLSWFEDLPESPNNSLSQIRRVPSLLPERYEPLLKKDLVCWKCGQEARNIPVLKSHLEKEWKEGKGEGVKQGAKDK